MSDLIELAEGIVARAEPGERIEAYVARGHEVEVRAYDGDVESLSSATTSGVGVRVLLSSGSEGARLGFAWAGSLDPEVVDTVLGEARDNAAFATPDPDVVLATPDGVEAAELDLWDPTVAAVATDDKISLVLDLERQVRAAPAIRQVASADYGDERVEVALASTTGIRSFSRRTAAYLSVSAIAGEGADSHTGSGFSVARGFGGLEVTRAAEDAVERSTRMLGATKPPSDRLTVVFDRRVVSTLLALIASALSGDAVVKGRSFFAGRVGEKVATGSFTLVDDPTDQRAFSASSHDAEGLACRRNVLVEDGVLRGFVYDSYAGRRAGRPSTGSAVRGGFRTAPG
ncbi:MAG: TldD/PmbA family protein, partial [Acidimicrobiales bacterium]